MQRAISEQQAQAVAALQRRAEASAAAQTKAGLAATELIERYAKAGKSTELYTKALNELNRAFEARAKVGDPVSDEQRNAAPMLAGGIRPGPSCRPRCPWLPSTTAPTWCAARAPASRARWG